MPMIAAVGALGAAGIGAATSAANRSQAAQQFQQAVNDYQSLGIPSAQALQIVMQHYKNAGLMTPELEQVAQQMPTQMANIQVSPDYKTAQLNALNQMQQLGNSGGMLTSDKATQAQDLNSIAAKNRGEQQVILADQARTGQLGSGLGLAMKEQAAQNAANQANQVGLATTGQAQARAIQALVNAGDMGTQYGNQQFGQQAQTAQAQDAINRFNTINSQDVANQNVGMQNAAQMYNLQNQQNLNNLNTGVDNTQAQYNSGAIQQAYGDAYNRAAGEAGAGQALGQNYLNNANAQGTMWGGIGQGIAQAGTAYQNNQNFQDWLNRMAPSSGSGSGSLSSQIANYKLPSMPGDDEEGM